MTAAAFLIIAIIALLVAMVAAIESKSLQWLSLHELKAYARRHARQRFDEIHDQMDDVAMGVEILMFLSLAVFSLAGVSWLSSMHHLDLDHLWEFGLLGVFSTIALLMATVWVPTAVAETVSTQYVYHTWPLFKRVGNLLAVLGWGAEVAKILVRRIVGLQEEIDDEEALEDEIMAIVAEGEQDGLLENEVRDMIRGVIELDDANVGDIMTPREDIDAMPIDLTWDEILETVTRLGRTRLPVYDSNADEIQGILYVKDLFAELRKAPGERLPLAEILRESWTVPESLRLDRLLRQFLKTRSHMALVWNEFNTLAGLVTIEDVLEEIVGEIVDESDKEEIGEIRLVHDHEAIVVGRAHLEEINEALGSELPIDDEFDTISGFLMHQLGRVPQKGDVVQWEELRITVLEATRRRAELVRIAATVPEG